MARPHKKPTFKCYKCKKNLKSAAQSFAHFGKYPTHRNEKQQKDFKANRALARIRKAERSTARRAYGTDVLPTVKRRGMRVVRTMKYCTNCGNNRKPSYRYCGGCGGKL